MAGTARGRRLDTRNAAKCGGAAAPQPPTPRAHLRSRAPHKPTPALRSAALRQPLSAIRFAPEASKAASGPGAGLGVTAHASSRRAHASLSLAALTCPCMQVNLARKRRKVEKVAVFRLHFIL